MALVNKDTVLADIVISEPSVLTVLNRFDIKLGVGDNTIEDICANKGIDIGLFLTILNTYINDRYFPESILKSISIPKIIEYLKKTNTYYSLFQLPNIERHFHSLITRGNQENGNLELMFGFFKEVKEELILRIQADEKWFENNLSLLEKVSLDALPAIKASKEYDIADSIEDKLSDLINMFVIHLKGEYDLNLCHAVLVALTTIQKDIKQNNRIRNRILRPVSDALLKANK